VRTVFQPDTSSCGIACVATVAGKTFATAKKVMCASYEAEDTSPRQLRTALKHFGIDSDPAKPIGKRRYKDLAFDAVLLGHDRYDCQAHWVVWDSKRKMMLDPIRIGTYFECSHFIRIRR
jgi:hypothetical protein